jgi:iron complex outermembrane receptor protein
VSYATSFLPTGGTDFSGRPFQPTTGQQYEIGVKYQPTGLNSFITLSAFNLTEQNVLTVDPAHPDFESQTGEVRSRGIELEGHATLTNRLNITLAYTYNSLKNTKSNDTDTTITGATEPLLGKKPPGIPEQMASVWANYTIHDGPARGLGFGGGIRYIGSSYGDDVNSFTVPSATLFDAALYYDIGAAFPRVQGLKFQLNATNLFNKSYVAECDSSTVCTFGPGRFVLATLRYAW